MPSASEISILYMASDASLSGDVGRDGGRDDDPDSDAVDDMGVCPSVVKLRCPRRSGVGTRTLMLGGDPGSGGACSLTSAPALGVWLPECACGGDDGVRRSSTPLVEKDTLSRLRWPCDDDLM